MAKMMLLLTHALPQLSVDVDVSELSVSDAFVETAIIAKAKMIFENMVCAVKNSVTSESVMLSFKLEGQYLMEKRIDHIVLQC